MGWPALSAFLAEHRPSVLNIAGACASDEPAVSTLVEAVLSAVLGSRGVL